MIACTVLSLLSDLAVSGLVRSVNIPSRCTFGTGLVVPNAPVSLSWGAVPNNGAPYFVVAQAQLTSAANGGLVGIYWKANRYLSFRADTNDVAGQWNCTDVNNDIEYIASASQIVVIEDLIHRGLLYSNLLSYCSSQYSDGTYSHLIVLDSSVGASVGTTFNVRASIDLTPNGTDTKIMKSFICTMDAPDLEWVLQTFNSSATLSTWCLGLQGNVYDGTGTGASNNSGLMLAQYLNSLVMVAGGNDYLLATPTSGDGMQGCLAQRTSVPVEIVLLFAVVTFGVVGMAFYLVIFSLRPEGIKNAPHSLLEWMGQAVQERVGRKISRRDLRQWGIGRNERNSLGVQMLGQRSNYNPVATEENVALARYT